MKLGQGRRSLTFLLTLALGLSASASAAAQSPVQWRGEDGGNGHYYQAVSALGRISWEQAKAAAEDVGGHLATITSPAENAFVFSLVDRPNFWEAVPSGDNNSHGPWLGGFQPSGSPEPAGGWGWDTGEVWAYTNWEVRQPDNAAGGLQEKYLHFFGWGLHNRSPRWNDIASTNHDVGAYVIEWDGLLKITDLVTPDRVGDLHTFISTNEVEIHGELQTLLPNASIRWRVEGREAARGLTDQVEFPLVSRQFFLRFRPADLEGFEGSRRQFVTGSLQASDPVAFEVTLELLVNGKQIGEASLTDSELGLLEQDETDILRQEYVDFGSRRVPERTDVIPALDPPLNEGFNDGNYNVQLSVDLPGLFDAVLAQYHGRPVTMPNGRRLRIGGQVVRIPMDAQMRVSSGYRNPRNNLEQGSRLPLKSKHLFGLALDLAPEPVTVTVGSQQVVLDLHRHLYPTLLDAALTQGRALTEDGGEPIRVGHRDEDHVHVHRRSVFMP